MGERRGSLWQLLVWSDLMPVGPDVERVETEYDGGSVGLVVGETVVAPTGDRAGSDADPGGKHGDRWMASGHQEGSEGPADPVEGLPAHAATSSGWSDSR